MKRQVTTVVPLMNEAANIDELSKRLLAVGKRLEDRYQFEYIFVDDGSSDDTWSLICGLARVHEEICGLSLSRNFGHQNALYCGYEAARGDAVVSLDGDLQDPPEFIETMLAAWEQGAEIVYAVRENRDGETRFKRWTAHCFYRLIRFLGEVKAPADCGDFRLMDRKALNGLLALREKHKYLRGMVGWLGFRSQTLVYRRPPRHGGSSKFNLIRMVRFAVDGVLSFSKFPLRLAFWMSALATLPFVLYLGYALLRSVMGGSELVPGWTSLLLCIVVFGSLNLFALGILGEYVGRIFDTVKNRPDYLVSATTQDIEASNDRTAGHIECPGEGESNSSHACRLL